MIPLGYMAKCTARRPDSIKAGVVIDIYSVSNCISEDFADYVKFWKHNGFWFFDSPDAIRTVAERNAISLDGTRLFYYEAYELEFNGEEWRPFKPETSIPTKVVPPSSKHLEGFDVVTFMAGTSPECSPLSCNSLAETVPTNEHCLFVSFEEAKAALKTGVFKDSEPGPYRIYAVNSVDWPNPITTPSVSHGEAD
jgi:hypothetical protein